MGHYKDIQKWLIAFIVVILIGLISTSSLLIYSFIDRGIPLSEPIQLENAEVTILEDQTHNLIKLTFNNIIAEKNELYSLKLLNKQGKTVETLNISIDYLFENMEEYIYEVETDLENIHYYTIEAKES